MEPHTADRARTRRFSTQHVNPTIGDNKLDTSRRNLVLVARTKQGHTRDFHTIAQHVRRQSPHTIPYVVTDRVYNNLRPWFWMRPTLVVSPLELKRFRPFRGRVCQNQFMLKSQEYLAISKTEIPIPRWQTLTESSQPDLSEFGPYVVVKPDCGGRGAEVRIKRKTRVRWSPPKNHRSLKQGKTDLIVQDFIYTGPWPISYRVTTWFGQPIFAWKVTASRHRRPLQDRYAFRGGADGGGMSIVSSGESCTFELCDDASILELARRTHAVFPDYPILGVDIVREVPSGQLYVLEANTCGHLWHFSSPTGIRIQRDNGIDFTRQFQGLELAAEILVRETRLRAA